MDPVIAELLKGPPSEDPLEQVDWLYRVSENLANSTDKATADIAVPIKEAADIIVGCKDLSEKDQEEAEPKVAALMLQAQGLAIYSYLVQIEKLRDALVEESKKLKSGSENMRKCMLLIQTYDKTLTALGKAYNGAREGKSDALDNLDEEFEKISVIAEQLRK